ncbi:methyl-accepting chemotaxis protein [Roseixanthobacter pseudopolyaromaticivorans]|uniref:methyl-accepting chemotaxis protein n=1 Tax=Xanthobacteraceae TaxID=335928 RepID=UPI0037276C9C
MLRKLSPDADTAVRPLEVAAPAAVQIPESPSTETSSDQIISLIEADIRRARARLAETAAQMAAACTDGVRGTEAIRSDSDRLAGKTEQAKTSAAELTGALTALASTNDEIGRQAHASDELATRAGEAASQASGAIVELRSAIGEIKAVVSLIADIASQTNLLALNASIEAARAGAAGAGFAVVASEVKGLASATHRATGEIGAKIDRLMRAAETSTDAVSQAIEAVGEIRPVASAVADAVAGQADSIADIGRAAALARTFADDVDAGARSIRAATIEAASAGATIEAASGAMGRGAEEMSRHLLTVLRQTPMGNRRRHPRWPVEIPGRITAAGADLRVKTIDLSLGGALLALQEGTLREGQSCTLELTGLSPLPCRVVGLSPLGCHLAFDQVGAPAVTAQLALVAKSYGTIIARAQRGAAAISAALENCVKSGRLTLDDLFDTEYRVIEGSDPVQYEVRALRVLDQTLPAIQEPILKEEASLSFAAAVDINGYLPVHNAQYAQPQRRGDRAWNMANARNRRIFDDRAGLLAARNTDPQLIQVYARDLGDKVVVMREVDVPINVAGRHWGGFRTAYRL